MSSARVYYSAGPGDVIGTFRHFSSGEDDPREVSVAYSAQFFGVCRELGIHALVETSRDDKSIVEEDWIRIQNRPVPFERARGLKYHFSRFYHALRTSVRILRFRPDIAFLSQIDHMYVLAILRPFGVKFVPVYHSVLWKQLQTPRGLGKLILGLNNWFLRHASDRIMCIGEVTSSQARSVVAGTAVPVTTFFPTFRASRFVSDEPAHPNATPKDARFLYVGRIEENKGVFDLLEVARQVDAVGREGVSFDFCGSGAALEELRKRAADLGLSARVRVHGQLPAEEVMQMYRSAFAVIVPTTSRFGEGFNKVVAEGVLSHKPVITSTLTNTTELLGDALVLVPPDDVSGYTSAILRLIDDPEYYRSVVEASYHVGELLFDMGQSWASAMRASMAGLDLVSEHEISSEELDSNACPQGGEPSCRSRGTTRRNDQFPREMACSESSQARTWRE